MRWAIIRNWSADEDSIHVCMWQSLRFQNPNRIMRVSTWRIVPVRYWSTSRIKKVSMQSEGVKGKESGEAGPEPRGVRRTSVCPGTPAQEYRAQAD